MSFTQGNYSVREDEGVLTVWVERSGDSESHVVIHIATHPSEGTATGEHVIHNLSPLDKLHVYYIHVIFYLACVCSH